MTSARSYTQTEIKTYSVTPSFKKTQEVYRHGEGQENIVILEL